MKPEKMREMTTDELVAKEKELADRITEARGTLPDVVYTKRDLYTIAELMAEMEVDGHRGDIVILKTALAHAAFNDRTKITQEDILIAAELALPHRLKRQPFQDTSTQLEELSEKLEQVRQEATEQTQQMVESAEMADSFEEKKTKVTR